MATRKNQKTSKTRKKTASVKKPDAIAREQEHTLLVIGAVLLVFFALFSLFSWFNKSAAFLKILANLETGFMGYGAYLIPVVFLWFAAQMVRAKPEFNKYRATMIALLPVFAGAMFFVFGYASFDWSDNPVAYLWTTGVNGEPTGFLAGLLGAALLTLLGKVGAVIVVIFLSVLSMFAFFDMTLPQLIRAFRDEAPKKEKNREDRAKTLAKSVYSGAETVKRKNRERREQAEERRMAMEQLEIELPKQNRQEFKLVSFEEEDLPEDELPKTVPVRIDPQLNHLPAEAVTLTEEERKAALRRTIAERQDSARAAAEAAENDDRDDDIDALRKVIYERQTSARIAAEAEPVTSREEKESLRKAISERQSHGIVTLVPDKGRPTLKKTSTQNSGGRQPLRVADIPLDHTIPDDDELLTEKSRRNAPIPKLSPDGEAFVKTLTDETVTVSEAREMPDFEPEMLEHIQTADNTEKEKLIEETQSQECFTNESANNETVEGDLFTASNEPEQLLGFDTIPIGKGNSEPEIPADIEPEESFEPESIIPDIDDSDDEIPVEEYIETVTAPEQLQEAEEAEEFHAAEKQKESERSHEARKSKAATQEKLPMDRVEETPAYRFPPVSLLNGVSGTASEGGDESEQNKRLLADTLRSFGVEPNITSIVRGPTVTRYEIKLDVGVKLSKITNLSEDIALALGAASVRIAAIPDKISIVGIEVPNRSTSIVRIREVLDSAEFEKSKSQISFAVGKDIGGNRIIGNIAKMPHLLVAGTTGSGKSVCMNSMIISLLYKAGPDDVKLIMVDPKMVELGIYNGIPHLMLPVVTDPKKASGTLQWAVSEMLRRYSLMAERGTRDIAGYNQSVADDPERTKLPKLVIIIDELADLMMACAKEVEESICRIAQMGRAAGVHLVVATQRPSANVITGLMKANIPSRIAFAVSSSMESRIILDAGGAEKLVGKGDMLFAPLGEGKAKRVQGCFITDEEVERVVNFIKQGGVASYDSKIEEEINRKASAAGKQAATYVSSEDNETSDDRDELLYDAVDVILELDQASVSVLQRKLKIGYARASRIVDQMEEIGIVGPHKGSKPRDIMISKEKWQSVKDGLIQLEDCL